ncbi:MAG: pyridoxamine 5'-phosphate oxidase [Bacteroidota bacterium]
MNINRDLSESRRDYSKDKLLESNISKNPIEQFDLWYQQAELELKDEVNAVALSTADLNGSVSSRMVLLKAFNENGFMFFSNYQSKKAEQIANNPNGALLFFWPSLQRQIRIEGEIIKTTAEISDTYFYSRPKDSQISAIISSQSKIVSDRDFLEKCFEKESKNPIHQRPENWGGYLLFPRSIEFWQGRSNRLHDRILYSLCNEKWIINRLAP